MDLTKITTEFGSLPRDVQIELFKAYLDGETIEFDAGSKFFEVKHPMWVNSAVYRVKPKPTTPDSINWDHVAINYRIMARDKNGGCFLFEKTPTKHSYFWNQPHACKTVSAEVYSSYKQGTCDWEDSLVIRQ